MQFSHIGTDNPLQEDLTTTKNPDTTDTTDPSAAVSETRGPPPKSTRDTATDGLTLRQRTPEVCPLCDRPLDTPAIEGINAGFCHNCAANIVHYTPLHAYVYGDTTNFDVYCYPKLAPSWEDAPADPTFIETDGYEGLPFDALSTTEQHIVDALATAGDPPSDYTKLTLKSILEPMPGNSADLNPEAVKAVNPATGQTTEIDESEQDTLIDALPRPTIFFARSVYTAELDTLQDLLSGTPTAQETLF